MKRRLTEFIVVLVVLAGIGLLWFPMLSSEVKPWRQGREVPTTLPAEERRVRSVGFSIIAPPHWAPQGDPNDPRLFLRPNTSIPRRTSSLGVWKYDQAPDIAGLVETEFQGQPALEGISLRPGTLDDPPSFGYGLYFQRDGIWYSLQFTAQIDAEAPPEMVMRYLETFQLEPEASAREPQMQPDL